MKRNVIVICIVVFVLALQQQRQNQAVLVPDKTPGGDDTLHLSSPLVGKSAPAFTLSNLKGEKVSLSSYKGKAVQLNFWATWCAPCKIETPWLIELEKQYKPEGFEILGISFDDLDKDDPKALAKDKAEISKAVDYLHISYPVLLDGDSISKPYGEPDVFPTSLFVDRDGKVVAATFGLTSKDDLENNIRKALGTAPADALNGAGK